jgi:uncharacterized membrane protein
MAASTPDRGARLADSDVVQLVGNVLRIGGLVAAAVAVLGGVLLLAEHGMARADFHEFIGEPAELRSVGGIVAGALRLQSHAVVQLGLLLLIATPVVRVAVSLVVFALQRDRLYMALTSVVLAVLLFSLLLGGHP